MVIVITKHDKTLKRCWTEVLIGASGTYGLMTPGLTGTDGILGTGLTGSCDRP